MKKIISITVTMLLLTTAVFAGEAKSKYAKINMGFRGGMPPQKEIQGFSNAYRTYFNIEPVFGIFPKKDNPKFALEFSLNMNFGHQSEYTYVYDNGDELEKKEERKQNIIIPNIQALYYFNPDAKFSVYLGAGVGLLFSKAIDFQVEESEQKKVTFFDMNFLVGGRYNISPKCEFCGTINFNLFQFKAWGLDAGLSFKF